MPALISFRQSFEDSHVLPPQYPFSKGQFPAAAGICGICSQLPPHDPAIYGRSSGTLIAVSAHRLPASGGSSFRSVEKYHYHRDRSWPAGCCPASRHWILAPARRISSGALWAYKAYGSRFLLRYLMVCIFSCQRSVEGRSGCF